MCVCRLLCACGRLLRAFVGFLRAIVPLRARTCRLLCACVELLCASI